MDILPPPTWTSSILEVKKSSIPHAGNGVFATCDIRKGMRLADYKGTFMTKKEFKAKYPGDQRYFYSLRQYVLDGHDTLTENVSHYINEQDTPNVGMKQRGLYALVNIKCGDELFLKYPKGYKEY